MTYVMIDLYCGEGGATAGYRAALGPDWKIVGVDSKPQLEARYLAAGGTEFVCADANDFPLHGAHAVHASPPCKDHTDLAAQSGGDGTGWMLPHTIGRIRESGLPYVVENVEGAEQHMDGAVMLCGSMFGLGAYTQVSYRRRGVVSYHPMFRTLRRHRLFLTSFAVLTPPDQCFGRPIGGVYGTGGGGAQTRGYKFDAEQSRIAMQMPWASRAGVSQAIPPTYTRFLGEQLLAQLGLAHAGGGP